MPGDWRSALALMPLTHTQSGNDAHPRLRAAHSVRNTGRGALRIQNLARGQVGVEGALRADLEQST